MSKPTKQISIRLLVIAQAVANVAILGLLVFGVIVFGTVSHRTAESIALTHIHRESGAIGDGLQMWLAEQGRGVSDPPDLADPVREIRLATATIAVLSETDQAKVDDIEQQLGVLLAAVERMVEADNPIEVYSQEVAALQSSFENLARDYEVAEILELEGSLGMVGVTGRLLMILGPVLLALAFFTVRMTSKVRARAARAEYAEELVRSKDDFLARVSHEIRTPLTGIVGLSTVLRDEKLEPEERSELTAIIASQGSEMALLVEDLLVASVADFNEVPISLTDIDLGESVASSIASFSENVPVTVAAGGVRAVADQARVSQVLRNLISNAFRHGGDDVAVDVSEHDGIAEVIVGDGGPAIPADDVTRIFEPYATRLGLAAYPGAVGVGLSISRDLARRMDGDLIYRHTGTRSEFVLSLVTADRQPAAGSTGVESGVDQEAA